jgi:small multidrug resistance pump
MAYAYLAAAIVTEVAATTALKFSEGFTRLWPAVGTAIGYILSFILLGLALKTMSVGTAYAIWSAVGTALIAAIGMIFLGESVTLARIGGILLVIVGVVVLNLSETHA